MSKNHHRFIFIALFITVSFSLVILSKWMQGKVDRVVENPPPAKVPSQAVQKKEVLKSRKRSDDVIRKTRLGPERNFSTSIFYQDGKEIARHKVSKQGVIYDQTGEIPSGRVKFINESNETYGVEYYHNGVKDGPARINYKNGSLKQEASYQYGKLLNRTEYYYDGTVKMKEDYADAREYDDDKKGGIGKVYSRDGTLKFEWYLINSDPVGYHKSYDRNGRLTAAIYYDEYGAVIPAKGR